MTRDEAFQQLSDYWAQVDRASKLRRFKGERSAALEDLNQRLPVVNTILSELAPDLPHIRAQWIADHVAAGPLVHRALRIIGTWRDVTDNCAGENPALLLRLLDPVISEVALPLWEAHKFRQAVNDAATSLNSFAQKRLGRYDIHDTSLMNEAFSADPPKPGKPRLRCPGNHRLLAIRDQQNGARQIAVGAFLAIRNPAHHMTGDWNPVTAFRHLAVLGQVAHYFRDWEIVYYVPPPPDFKELNAALTRMAIAADGERS
jgi:hypothetical protein